MNCVYARETLSPSGCGKQAAASPPCHDSSATVATVDVFVVALPPVGGAVEAGEDPSSDDDSQAKENVWGNNHFLKNGEDDSTSDKKSVDVTHIKSALHVSGVTCIK